MTIIGLATMNNDINSINVFLLHCIYSINEGTKSLNQLAKVLKRTKYNIQIICICNKDKINLNINDLNISYISGSNQLHEFSAWQEGYQLIKEDIDDRSLVLLTNDTILSNHPFYGCLDLALLKCLNSLSSNSQNSIIGIRQVLDFNEVKDYLSSFLVILNGRQTIHKVLDGILNIEFDARINEGNSNEILIYCDDKYYQDFINNWLTEPGKKSWHKAEKLTDQSISRLQMKAKCILLEHSISIRAKKNNIKIFDIFEFTGLKYLRYIYSFRKDYFF
jgi:hypothetical protein